MRCYLALIFFFFLRKKTRQNKSKSRPNWIPWSKSNVLINKKNHKYTWIKFQIFGNNPKKTKFKTGRSEKSNWTTKHDVTEFPTVGIVTETIMDKLLPPNSNKNKTMVIIYRCVRCCCSTWSYEFEQRCLRNDDYLWAHIRYLWKVPTQGSYSSLTLVTKFK